MADPLTEIGQARIRYLSAFVRGEITDAELKKKLAMADRSEARIASAAKRLEVRQNAIANWRQRQRLERALRASLEATP